MLKILSDIGTTLINDEGKATVYLKKPIQCKRCDRAVMIVINEMGSSRCLSCPDPKETLKEKK